MPKVGPINRRDLIRYLRELGFQGPLVGGNHEYMIKGQTRLIIPNPHAGDISRGLLIRLLRQGGIDRDEWEKL